MWATPALIIYRQIKTKNHKRVNKSIIEGEDRKGLLISDNTGGHYRERKRQNVMSTREITGQQMHLQRKWQNAREPEKL